MLTMTFQGQDLLQLREQILVSVSVKLVLSWTHTQTSVNTL